MTVQAEAFQWSGRPRITHMGINVVDIDRMVAFYTRVLGLSVSDFGYSERLGCKLAFLTSDPGTHHQIVLVGSRAEGTESTVNQISFTVPSLDDLRAANRRLLDEGIEANPINHGNAWSVYSFDPEGNRMEAFIDSPWQVAQPFGVELDLDMSDEEIRQTTEEMLKDYPSAQPMEEWRAKQAKVYGLE